MLLCGLEPCTPYWWRLPYLAYGNSSALANGVCEHLVPALIFFFTVAHENIMFVF